MTAFEKVVFVVSHVIAYAYYQLQAHQDDYKVKIPAATKTISAVQLPMLYDGPAMPMPSLELFSPNADNDFGHRMQLLLASMFGCMQTFFSVVLPWLLLALVCGMLVCSLSFAKALSNKIVQTAGKTAEKCTQVELENQRLEGLLSSLHKTHQGDLALMEAEIGRLRGEMSTADGILVKAYSQLEKFVPATGEFLLASMGSSFGPLPRQKLDLDDGMLAEQLGPLLSCLMEDLGYIMDAVEQLQAGPAAAPAPGSQALVRALQPSSNLQPDLEPHVVSPAGLPSEQVERQGNTEKGVAEETPQEGSQKKKTRRAGRRIRQAKEKAKASRSTEAEGPGTGSSTTTDRPSAEGAPTPDNQASESGTRSGGLWASKWAPQG